MGCGVYWQQIHELEKAMTTMERFGISTTDPAYLSLQGRSGALLAQVGAKFPRSYDWLTFLVGESPGTIRLGHDVETGWFSEARVTPAAPPIYHRLSDQEAMAVLKKEMSPELHDKLFILDDYLGE